MSLGLNPKRNRFGRGGREGKAFYRQFIATVRCTVHNRVASLGSIFVSDFDVNSTLDPKTLFWIIEAPI